MVLSYKKKKSTGTTLYNVSGNSILATSKICFRVAQF